MSVFRCVPITWAKLCDLWSVQLMWALIALCFALLTPTVTTEAAQAWQIVQLGSDIQGENAGDRYGASVSLSADGTVIAIGAPQNDGSGSNAGHVRVYAWKDDTWTQRGADIGGTDSADHSGITVALSRDGQVLAIGATWHSYIDGPPFGVGQVRIFAWSGNAWIQRGMDIDGTVEWGESGQGIALSADGNVVAIGTPMNDADGGLAGHTRVYTWSGTSWAQRGLDLEGEGAYSASGASVSLSSDGRVVAIGAWGNSANGDNSGHTRVYTWNGTSWVQRGLDIDGEASGDYSGGSVSLSADGNIVAIGASHNSNENGGLSGHARVYHWTGLHWIQRGHDIDGEAGGDQSGVSVSLNSDGSTIAIGAPYNSSGDGGYEFPVGHTRIYSWNGASWEQLGLDIDGVPENEQSGYSVSLSADGRTVAVGAPGKFGSTTDPGSVRVYTLSPPTEKPDLAVIIWLLQQNKQLQSD